MGKVNLFKVLLTMILSVNLMTAPVFAASSKAAKTKAPAKQAQPEIGSDRLGVMTFAQVARLNDRMRREYVALIRKATLEVDGFQNKFGKTYGAAGVTEYDQYASNASWLESFANAVTPSNARVLPTNRCLHAGNISEYPAGAFQAANCNGDGCEPGRVAGQCVGVPCKFGALKGFTCNYTYSGMINAPDRGCMSNTVVENARFSNACNVRRLQLAQEKAGEVRTLVNEVNNFYGFNPNGTYRSDTCKSEGSRNLMNRLIGSAYSDESYAMLIKVAYFCKSNGQGLPDGLNNFTGEADAVTSFEAIEKDFNKLNQSVDSIFAGYMRHCPSQMTTKDVADLRAKLPAYQANGTIRGARRGSTFYYQEEKRLKALAALDAATKPTHHNVLEIEECELLNLRWRGLKQAFTDLRGTYPRIADENPPAPIPPVGPSEATRVTPTGCSEAVTREGALLAQPAARCMPCLIQTTENLKDSRSSDPAVKAQAGTYRASRKYLSLVSTMALACGDGLLYDSTVTPEMMVDYMHAFAYCKSDTYDWNGSESADDKRLTMLWGDQKYWRQGKQGDAKDDRPDRDGQFKRIYGVSYSKAQEMFCDPSNRRGMRNRTPYTPAEKSRLLANRRRQFNAGVNAFGNGRDEDNSGALADCLGEARANASAFNRDSGLCVGFAKFGGSGAPSPAENQMRSTFLNDPAIIDFDNNCAIPKQLEEYRTRYTGRGQETDVCVDRNGDDKDDNTGAACSPKDSPLQAACFLDPRDNTPVGAEYQQYRISDTVPGRLYPRFCSTGVSSETARFSYRQASACDISAGDSRAIGNDGPRRGSAQ